MTDFSDLLRPDAVQTGVAAASKKLLFAQLGTLAAAETGIDARVLAERLGDRERLGSTGFGNGVAIPHAKVEGLAAVTGAFVRLAQPLDVQAVDGLPVDLVFALFSPATGAPDHLKALARVSRRLRDLPFLDKLRGAGSRDAVFALFTADATRDAA